MKTIQLKYYTDPGHGWVAVKRKMLDELSIKHKITCFSYQKGQTVYLEEDQDASCLIESLKAKGAIVTFKQIHHDRSSPIRYYKHFSSTLTSV